MVCLIRRCLLLLACLSGLAACEDRETLAPVVEANWRALHSTATRHQVRAGETLYAIAFRYDLDYRQLALLNRIQPPYRLVVNQVLLLKSSDSSPLVPRYTPSVQTYHPTTRPYPPSLSNGTWSWPVRGRIIASFVPQLGQKGIDIVGSKGQPIRAASGGTVAYAGDGLNGYGNLILIKHDHQYLSAYGYNARNLVRVGQTVRAGQTIAEMGMGNRHRYAVHFEIRKAGQPVNPAYYLH